MEKLGNWKQQSLEDLAKKHSSLLGHKEKTDLSQLTFLMVVNILWRIACFSASSQQLHSWAEALTAISGMVIIDGFMHVSNVSKQLNYAAQGISE